MHLFSNRLKDNDNIDNNDTDYVQADNKEYY